MRSGLALAVSGTICWLCLSAAGGGEATRSIWERETLTDNWFGAGEALADKGLSFQCALLQTYQVNVHGGRSTDSDEGRYQGRYDLEFKADLEKLAGLTGGSLYASARGGWTPGIGPTSVGGLFDVNGTAYGDNPIVLRQLYYEQNLLDRRIRIRVGRVDLTGGFECRGCKVSFDGNRFANDEGCQFLNASLVNNPTIPFPAIGMGAMVHVEPVEGWYVTVGAADANAVGTRSGFDTAFGSPGEFFSIYETGVVPEFPSAQGPLAGAYRVGFWIDPRARERFRGGTERDTVGFYTSCDQMLWRAGGGKDAGQGLGAFARYGLADADVSAVKNFWSAGLQYQGLLPGREKDVLAAGVGSGGISRQSELPASRETVIEAYYNIAVTPWLHVAPDVQYILHPGGQTSVDDAVVVGVRVQMSF